MVDLGAAIDEVLKLIEVCEVRVTIRHEWRGPTFVQDIDIHAAVQKPIENASLMTVYSTGYVQGRLAVSSAGINLCRRSLIILEGL
jgi:hypothetical protein